LTSRAPLNYREKQRSECVFQFSRRVARSQNSVQEVAVMVSRVIGWGDLPDNETILRGETPNGPTRLHGNTVPIKTANIARSAFLGLSVLTLCAIAYLGVKLWPEIKQALSDDDAVTRAKRGAGSLWGHEQHWAPRSLTLAAQPGLDRSVVLDPSAALMMPPSTAPAAASESTAAPAAANSAINRTTQIPPSAPVLKPDARLVVAVAPVVTPVAPSSAARPHATPLRAATRAPAGEPVAPILTPTAQVPNVATAPAPRKPDVASEPIPLPAPAFPRGESALRAPANDANAATKNDRDDRTPSLKERSRDAAIISPILVN
jgi:hypothetical protein